jgi:hypothetical protein
VEKVVPLITAAQIGVEWVLVADANDIEAGIDLRLLNGTEHTRYGLQYDYVDDTLDRRDDAGAYVTVDATVVTAFGTYIWQHFKFVVDPVAREYVRGRLGDQEYDLSGLGGEQSVGTAFRGISINLLSLDTAGAGAAAYFGLLVVTVNE